MFRQGRGVCAPCGPNLSGFAHSAKSGLIKSAAQDPQVDRYCMKDGRCLYMAVSVCQWPGSCLKSARV